jgi:hypothetical protein
MKVMSYFECLGANGGQYPNRVIIVTGLMWLRTRKFCVILSIWQHSQRTRYLLLKRDYSLELQSNCNEDDSSSNNIKDNSLPHQGHSVLIRTIVLFRSSLVVWFHISNLGKISIQGTEGWFFRYCRKKKYTVCEYREEIRKERILWLNKTDLSRQLLKHKHRH